MESVKNVFRVDWSSLREQNTAYWTALLCSSLAWTRCFREDSLDWRLPHLTRGLSMSFLHMFFYFCCFGYAGHVRLSALCSSAKGLISLQSEQPAVSVLYLFMTLIINALPMIGVIFVLRWITLLLELEIINVLFKIREWQDGSAWLLVEALTTVGVWLRKMQGKSWVPQQYGCESKGSVSLLESVDATLYLCSIKLHTCFFWRCIGLMLAILLSITNY